MKFSCLILLLIISIEEVLSQEICFDNIIEEYLEENECTDTEEFILKLHKLHAEPTNINSISLSDLLFLPFFTKSDIKNIKSYIEDNGYLLTVNSLLLVDGFTRNRLSRLKGFIYASVPSENILCLDTNLFKRSHSEIIGRLQRSFDNKDNKYQGNMWKYYSRMKIKCKERLIIGLTLEKDAGESFSNNKPSGFDYYSAYIQLNYKNKLNQINIGDYKVSWGQGLVVGSNFGNFKSANTINYGAGVNNLNKYSSSDENKFFRGIAFKYKPFTKIELIPIYSNKQVDARLNSDGIVSLNTMGYHRSISELDLKDKANEQMLGMRVIWNDMNFQIGLNYIHYSINPDILKSKYKWKQHDFIGKENDNLSVDYKFTISRFYIFGESAISKNRGIANILGTNFITNNGAQISVVYRSYDKDYHTIYGNGFGESHKTSNEKGLYFGVEYSPVRKLKLNIYYDYFKFPSISYRMSKGGKGREYLINLDYRLNSKTDIVLRCKSERKPLDKKMKFNTTTLNRLKNSYRLSIINNISEIYRLQGRLEYSTYKYGELFEKGSMLYLDFKYSSLSKNLKLQSRVVYFNTDSYNTRIYTYENDLLYTFSFPSYYYKGWRCYLNASCKILDSVSLYLKAGLTYWKSHSNKQDVKLQIRIKL